MFGISYWMLPLVAGLVWLGTLLAMIGTWAAKGKEDYPWEARHEGLPYISDIAATHWGYPLFIAGSCVSIVTFDFAFVSERWLRHRGRLAHNYNITEKILSGFATGFAIIGSIGLILLTIFDTRRHHHVHDAMLVLFIAGFIISAIFLCAEYQRLGIHFREYRILRISFWIKLAFIFVEVALAIAFGVLGDQKHYTGAAVVEWVISLLFIMYQLSFIIDFLPATRTRARGDRFPPVQESHDPNGPATQAGGNMLGGPVYTRDGQGGVDPEKGSHNSNQPMMAKNF